MHTLCEVAVKAFVAGEASEAGLVVFDVIRSFARLGEVHRLRASSALVTSPKAGRSLVHCMIFIVFRYGCQESCQVRLHARKARKNHHRHITHPNNNYLRGSISAAPSIPGSGRAWAPRTPHILDLVPGSQPVTPTVYFTLNQLGTRQQKAFYSMIFNKR